MPVDIRSSAQVDSSAFLDNAVVTVLAGEYLMFDYGGKFPSACCACLTLETEDGEEHKEYWTCGSNLVPSADGKTLEPKEPGAQLRKNTKWGFFTRNLEAKFPAEAVPADGNIDFLNGTKALLMRIVGPKWKGLRGEGEPEEEEKKIAVFDQILEYPEGVSRVDTAAIEKEAEKIINAQLKKSKKPVVWNEVVTLCFDQLKASDSSMRLQQLAYDQKFLSSPDRPWEYDEKKQTLTAK